MQEFEQFEYSSTFAHEFGIFGVTDAPTYPRVACQRLLNV